MDSAVNIPGDLIEPLRNASRKLAREWGFLQPTFAGTRLSPGAVHCLIEIGDRHVCGASGLCAELKVSRKRLNQLLSELLANGNIAVYVHGGDEVVGKGVSSDVGTHASSEVAYCLTPAGAQTLSAINAYAQNQVAKALAAAHPDTAADITAALHLYAAALERSSFAESVSTSDDSRPPSPEPAPAPAVTITRGYRPALLGRTLEMHMDFYYKTVGWGREFETGLGETLADLISRLDRPMNEAWAAVQTITASGSGSLAVERIVGVIFIDGEISGREGCARLRAFIVDESARGLGLGKKLLREAMAFVRGQGFLECRLSTMRQLSAARKLYEEEGFVSICEEMEPTWGDDVLAMQYAWTRDSQNQT